ncbi:MAG TPA: DUF4974 domain-containing protein [Bacteroidetes bacterium]|nr:DUF4974 domain-containing protein [Bacteroidota bacterium]
MEKDKYISLIYKKLKGEASPSEQSALDEWLNISEDNPLLFQQIKKEWELSANYIPNIEIDTKADFELLRQRVRQHKAKEKQAAKIVQLRPRRQWLAWAAAAAIILISGWWFFNKNNIADNMLVAQTAAAEKKDFVLSDGTHIWLNENSSFSYPENFTGKQRFVKLEGEAYFKVSKNKKMPFVIETAEAKIKVLGTAFNLRAYTDGPVVEVAVDEGKVQLMPKNSKQSLVLTLNKKGVYDIANRSLKEFNVETKNASFWKTGTLVYKDTPLEKVVADLENYFNIEIKIETENMGQCRVTGRFPNANAKDILEHIASSFQMELSSKGGRIYELKKGACQ